MKRWISEHLEKILKNLPTNPGVYQMKDKDENIMYVGKAKNLKNRVSSYFDRTNDLTAAKKQMVWKIVDIELIICSTEVEALILETNLIKHISPKYNILMKDDKNLAYIKITNSPVPELIKTRKKIRDGGEYFGPYVSSVEQSVRSLRRIFKIRNCRMRFEHDREARILITDKAGKTIPCMDYYIWLCPAPCFLHGEKISQHSNNIHSARNFLSGNAGELLSRLEEDMRVKSKNLEFEEALKIKETIEALRGLWEKQSVRDIIDGNVDVFLQYEKYDKLYIVLTQVRSSQVVWVFRHEVSLGADDKDGLLVAFLTKQYLDNEDLPDILITQDVITDESFLDFLKGKKITHEIPKIGPKNDIIQFTLNQVREYAYKREMETLENRILNRDHMMHILDALGYPYPKKGEIVFECYDISHTDGHFTYASRVVIVNGKPDPSRYKKYKIKTLYDGMIDDFASHREVMVRRTIEWFEQNNFPHLIIIDGGKGQLSSAISGIKEGIFVSQQKTQERIQSIGNIEQESNNEALSFDFFPSICSIAKREEEVFLPWKKEPVMFEKWTPELMVIQKARDESHRFSITANRQARTKAMKKNILEELPGFGPVTRKKLLKIAGSVEELKNMNLEEIEKICTKKQIETLKDHGII